MENSPLNTLQQLMTITMEECGELVQQCSKTQRKFSTVEQALEDNERAVVNRIKLVEEAGDVLCMIELMVEHGLLTNEELGARVNVKREKLKTWSNLIVEDDLENLG
jgi:NTP pyrophosphatase (non-canonical NTP hydrolase)